MIVVVRVVVVVVVVLLDLPVRLISLTARTNWLQLFIAVVIVTDWDSLWDLTHGK